MASEKNAENQNATDEKKADIVAETKAALADGRKPLPKGVRINFGDVEPIRTVGK